MSNLYKGPYHVSDNLAKRFQRRKFLEIDQSETKTTVAAMFVNGSGRNEQSL
jgi:hypothetical protein